MPLVTDKTTLGRTREASSERLRASWGQAIALQRKALGWTQKQLGDAMAPAVSQQAVAQWENGETAPRWHHQVAIARALGVPHRVLFAITEDVA